VLLAISSCRKEEHAITAERIPVGTDADLTSIIRTDLGYILGGHHDKKGIVLFSTDSENWSVLNDALETGINDVHYFNGIIYAAADSFKIFTSSDSGASWNTIWMQGILSMEYITDIKSITSYGNSLYICGGRGFANGFTGVSTDGGNHWNFFPADHELRRIACRNEWNAIAVGYGAIYITNDGGNSWQVTGPEGHFWTDVVYDYGMYYACSYSGTIAFSSDGRQWFFSKVGAGAFNHGLHINSLRLNEEELIAFGNDGKGIISLDHGKNWKNLKFETEFHIYASLSGNAGTGLVAGENGMLFRYHYNH
jgi:photosystem II stability/assembly factor-like uncharacterized protein